MEDMLRQKGPLEELLVRKFTWQMLIGVEFLHGKGIIHKDIKGYFERSYARNNLAYSKNFKFTLDDLF